MDVVITGPGEVVVCLINRDGKTLLQERLQVSGSSRVSAHRPMDLVVETRAAKVPVSPVLISHGGRQSVTFDGDEPAAFTKRRCREIGCTDTLAEDAALGQVQRLVEEPTQSFSGRMLPPRP